MNNITTELPIIALFKIQAAEERSRIISIMKCAYLIAKKNYAISCLEDIAALSGLGTSYVTRSACTEFIQTIACTIREELCLCIQKSQCLGLMVDESTEIDKNAALIIYVGQGV